MKAYCGDINPEWVIMNQAHDAEQHIGKDCNKKIRNTFGSNKG